jgi:hypothetical protein
MVISLYLKAVEIWRSGASGGWGGGGGGGGRPFHACLSTIRPCRFLPLYPTLFYPKIHSRVSPSLIWKVGLVQCRRFVSGRATVRRKVTPEKLERGGPADCWNWGKWGRKEYIWKSHLLVGSLGLSCLYKRFLFCLGCPRWLGTKKVFLTGHYFTSFVPIAHQQARQAAVLRRLSLNQYLWFC